MPLYEHVFIARQDLSNAQAEALIEHCGTLLRSARLTESGKLLRHPSKPGPENHSPTAKEIQACQGVVGSCSD